MEALFQKNRLKSDFPFTLSVSEGAFSFPHHWHDEIEIVYVVNGKMKIGINNSIYELKERDMIIISSGDVHYFLGSTIYSKRVIIQFNLAIFDNLSSLSDRRIIRTLFDNIKSLSSQWEHKVQKDIEGQVLSLVEEYTGAQSGYKLALKARLYDLAVILMRMIPSEYLEKEDENKHREKLKRLESIFQYVENNFNQPITLEEAADIAGFSLYHFTRFFKECIGITFGQYLSNYRITRAEWFLLNDDESITEIAFKSGFNSVKTFNRIFKKAKGCAPTEYIKKQKMRIY
jgi:AraC-like DNA-binding protein